MSPGSGGHRRSDDAPLVDPVALHRFSTGSDRHLDEWMGAHVCSRGGVEGTAFTVWAPAAAAVAVVGDFDGWRDGHDLVPAGGGVWSTFVPGVGDGSRYLFEVHPRQGPPRRKADPMAFRAAPMPDTASVVHVSAHRWTDEAWIAARSATPVAEAPLSVYEVHLGSWRHRAGADQRPLGYRELAEQLPAYVAALGFTHVELLPVMAHPFRGSWGYQVTSYYAPDPSLGEPDDLRAMIDALHRHGIGVLLDWVPAHFPRDDWALAAFDGTACYEHPDPRRGAHPDWGTLIFDYGRPEVRNFLVANALFWAREYHADGLRVDAVASMLYLDYSRPPGGWEPNAQGGRENLEAVAFIRELDDAVHAEVPGVIVVAEESTAWPGVTRPTDQGGLGFDAKWNLGWMHDTLDYFAAAPARRGPAHERITFGLVYAFSETFVLPLSHDEVVHEKRSLIDKMAGGRAERFAGLRALLAHQWAHPGKQLLFMGAELAQEREWSHDRQLDWFLLDDAAHAGIQALVADLNRGYRHHPALWERDTRPDGFSWLTVDAAGRLEEAALLDGVFAYLRRGADVLRPVACVANLSATPFPRRQVGLPAPGRWREVLNTDATAYGGAGGGGGGEGVVAEPDGGHGQPCSALIDLPALSVLWLTPETS